MRVIDTAAAKALLEAPPQGLIVLDVRAPAEFEDGRLPGATMLNIWDTSFADRLLALDRSVPYLVYCKAGGRSASAAEFMITNGFEDVVDYRGGWLAWAQAGHPFDV